MRRSLPAPLLAVASLALAGGGLYALSWLLGMLYVRVQVRVELPAAPSSGPVEVEAFRHWGKPERLRSVGPQSGNPLEFSWAGGGGLITYPFLGLGFTRAVVRVPGAEPLELPLSCGDWSVERPHWLTFGAFTAAYGYECHAQARLR